MLVLAGVLAAAFIGRLGGLGVTWLPPLSLIAVALALVHLVDVVSDPGRLSVLMRAVRKHWFVLAVGVLVLVTLAVRLPNLGSDLGRVPLDIDEHRLASSVQHYFSTGELQHDTVEHYPGLVFWLFSAASFISFVWRLAGGMVTPPSDLPIELFVLAARMANVFIAAATVAITALIARRMAGRASGLLAAALVAIAPLSIDTTTIVRDDAGMVLAVMAAVLLALVSYDRQRTGWFASAGAAAGLAAGIKYSSVFALVPVLLALAAPGLGRKRPVSAIAALTGFVAAVAVTNHFVWADFPNFLRQLTDQVAITGIGHWAAKTNPAAFYVSVLDRFGPGVGLLVAAAALGVYALATRRADWWIVVTFPVLYVAFMIQRPAQFPRWVYPTLPFVAILGASALVVFVGRVRSWAAGRGGVASRAAMSAAGVVVIAVLVQPFWSGVVAFSRRVTPPTLVQAERWIEANAAPGDVVLLENGWLDLSGTALQPRRVRQPWGSPCRGR